MYSSPRKQACLTILTIQELYYISGYFSQTHLATLFANVVLSEWPLILTQRKRISRQLSEFYLGGLAKYEDLHTYLHTYIAVPRYTAFINEPLFTYVDLIQKKYFQSPLKAIALIWGGIRSHGLSLRRRRGNH
jgi:hypothetical protein